MKFDNLAHTKAPIAIFGATSNIAKEFIKLSAEKYGENFLLFTRNQLASKAWVNKNNLSKHCIVMKYDEFNYELEWSSVINFIGIGDPRRLQSISNDIIEINDFFDIKIIDVLKRNPDRKYIYLSSGSVYCSDFLKPLHSDTTLKIKLNGTQKYHQYSIAKLISELRHRSLKNLNIIDIRIFNYLHNNSPEKDSSFIGSILHSLKTNNHFVTTDQNITRDFVDYTLFLESIFCLLNAEGHNNAYDIYSKKPVAKLELLNELSNDFGLKLKIKETGNINLFEPTGSKPMYYSMDRRLKKYGYNPSKTSKEIVLSYVKNLQADVLRN